MLKDKLYTIHLHTEGSVRENIMQCYQFHW